MLGDAMPCQENSCSEKLDGTVLVLVDHCLQKKSLSEGHEILSEQSQQLLSLARSLTTGKLVALSMTRYPDEKQLAAHGVDVIASVYSNSNEYDISQPVKNDCQLDSFFPERIAEALGAAIKIYQPCALLLVSHSFGRQVAAAVAVSEGSGAAVDVTHVSVSQHEIIAGKSVLSGTWETTFHATHGLPIVAIKTAGLPDMPLATPSVPACEKVNVTYSARAQAVTLVSNIHDEETTRSLVEAPVVVCGGAGTRGDFSLIKQLAQHLGAAVGATRVAADQGWIERSAQIGLSGISVAPQLYIGAGISGDIHHVSGIRGAKTIVAINNDPDAPIFDLADLGIVGDYERVIKEALEHLS